MVTIRKVLEVWIEDSVKHFLLDSLRLVTTRLQRLQLFIGHRALLLFSLHLLDLF